MTKTFNKMASTLLGLTLFASATTATAAIPKEIQPEPPLDQLSELVDAYEQHEMFRGINNDQLPATLADGLQLGDLRVLPGESEPGLRLDGYVDYGSTDGGARIVAASDGPGMDRFGIIVNENDPDQYRLPVSIPDGSDVTQTPAGTIEITTADGDTTTLAPALAVDAEGKVLPASYKLSDDALHVTVDLGGATYPVMVDPVTSRYWWGTKQWFSRSEVRRQASWWQVARIVGVACNYAPWSLKSLCKKTVGRYTSWVLNTWRDAKRYNQCVWMNMTWTGQVTGIGRYRCNWG